MILIIVESPAKTKKIAAFIPGARVLASFGHIRDLPKKKMGIDLKTFQAEYEITKGKIVSALRAAAQKASEIYLAMDPDREGDGIAYHLTQILRLSHPRVRRMTFREITKPAVQKALAVAREDGRLSMNQVNSYLARRMGDRIMGYKVSPWLNRHIRGARSAGRVQSVVVRMCVDREREIAEHVPEEKYNIKGIFSTESKSLVEGNLHQVPNSHPEALKVLQFCVEAKFSVKKTKTQIVFHSPAPPYKTSTFQQDAARRGIPPKIAMKYAQKLYEAGKITYHRTDSTNLSAVFKGEAKEFITQKYGTEYLSDFMKKFKNSSHSGKKKLKKGEQGGHEAIRPTKVQFEFLGGNFDGRAKMLYRMIWVRAVGSLMAKEKCQRYLAEIHLSNTPDYWFVASFLKTLFLGFKILTFKKEEEKKEERNTAVMKLKENDKLSYEVIESQQTFSEPPKRYMEASLIKQMEKLGIGRPSTYANSVAGILSRNYVEKKANTITKKDCFLDVLKKGKIESSTKMVSFGDRKMRLFPTKLGTDKVTFMKQAMPVMMDYQFTSNMEENLDQIAQGKIDWKNVLGGLTSKIVTALEQNKPKRMSAQEKKERKEKRTLGKYKGKPVEFHSGRYGPFFSWGEVNYSLPKDKLVPSMVTMDEVTAIIEKKKKATTFLVEYPTTWEGRKGKIGILNGNWGYYLKFVPDKGKGKKTDSLFIPKKLRQDEKAVRALTLKDCMKFANDAKEYRSKPRPSYSGKKYSKR